MDLLEKLLVDLHSSIDNEESKIDCVSLVANIEAIALAEMEPADLEYTTSLLFSSTSPPSLLMFLEDSSRSKDKEIVSAKKNALKFLAQFIKVMPYMVDKTGPEIFKTLLTLFKKETSGEVKSCLLLPAKNLLRSANIATAFETENSELPVESVYKILLDELHQSASKVGKGLRCEALKTLGLLVFAFPVHPATAQSISPILTLCENALQQNFSKSCKEPDFSAIAGAFSCLDRCLVQFEEKYTNNAELWKFLLQAVMATTSSDTSRYSACNKAVRLISHHAELFGQLIGHNAGTSYNLLYSMHSAGKKSMMKHSSNALYTVLRQIAMFVVNSSTTSNGGSGSTDTADAVRTVEKLYTEYMNILLNGTNPTTTTTTNTTTTSTTNTTSTGIDSSVAQQEGLMHAVQGLAAIAPAVVTLFNNNASNNNSITSAGSRSVTGTVLSIIEAAQHYCRFAESATTTTSQDTNSTTPDNTTTTNTTADTTTVDVVTDNTNMYETLTVKHKKVLFLMAVTSFVSAVSTHTSTSPSTNATLQFTPAVVQFIQEYVVDSIVCYSRFWSKQQVQVCSTLCTLSHALMTLSYYYTNSTTTASTNTSTSTTTDPTTLYTSLLHCISHTLLLRTVSRTILHESVNPSQARLSLYTLQPEDRLLYAYIDLWTELLYPANKHTNALLMRYYNPSYNTHFAERLYDMLFTQVLSMLTTLDLRYDNISTSNSTNTNTDTTSTANDNTIIPTNIADQDILLNLITFLQLLLPQCEAHFNNRCSVWFSMIVNRIVMLAEQYPLISALYRLLRCVLSVCGSVTNVIVNPLHTSISDSSINSTNSNSMDIVTTNNTTPNNTTTSNNECVLTLKSFMLSLQQRIHTSSEHYHYELLDAIISLILSSHRILTIQDIITTLRMSLLTGVQALLSVQLLTEYTLHNNTLLLPYLPTLLPLFDSYLTVNTSNSDSSGKMYLKSAANSNKINKNKPTTSTTSNTTTTTSTSSDATDTTLQIAILRLLGRLGGNNKHLVTPAEHTIQDMIVWSEREVVSVDVPLGAADGQLRVCLDVILPRIVALCTTGTNTSSSSGNSSTSGGSGSSTGDSGVDAQCVSAAAETLHAIILYMVGSASSISGSRDKTTLYTSTYEHIFPVVIQLAVSELACGVVYKELLFQLVRWFSGHNQVHEKDTLALLDALFSKLSDPAAESSVRDLCANGILEFFVWAIKQSTKAQLAKHPGSVESILERVCVLISHPQASQRTAAVILLRTLYPSFREESSVVHKYTLRVIYLLSKSMRLYDHAATQQEISAVLLKYEQMVVVTVVDRDDVARLVSPAEDRGYPSSLSDLVYELYTHALTSDTILHRRQCMRSFSALAPLLSSGSSSSGGGGSRGQVGSTSTEAAQLNGVQSFLLNLVCKHNKQNSTSNVSTVAGVLVSTIEGSGGSNAKPTLHNSTASIGTNGSSGDTTYTYTTYMRSFNAKLDSYNWLIKMNYVSVLDILMYNSNSNTSSSHKKRKSGSEEPAVCSVMNSISTYLSNYANDEIYLGSTSDGDIGAVCSVRREALYRVIILLSNVFASVRTLPSADQSSIVNLLRDSGVYCDALHTIIANTLLPTTHTTHTMNTDYDIYYATQLLYTHVKYDLTLVYECSSIYTTTVNKYINVVLDSTADGTLTAQQLHSLLHFYNTIKQCNMLTIVFGGNHSVENVKFAVSILTNILTSIHTTSTSTTLTTATNTTSSNTNTTPLAISLGAAALELCVSVGLALAHTTDSDNDVPTLLQLLADPVVCSVLLLHYQDTLVTLLTSTNTNLSLVNSNNLQQYVHTAYNTTTSTDDYTTHLRTLFPTILSVLTAQLIAQASNSTYNTTTSIRTNDTVNTLLTVCTEHNICNMLPDNIILLLLEAATHTTGTSTNSSVDKLHEYVLNSCIHAFNGTYKPPTTTATANASATTTSATTLVDYIIIRLKWLPYVIPGTVQGTPLPYSTFYTTTTTSSTTSVVISKQAELADSLEELAATHFPLHSHSIQVSSVEGRQYFKLLQAYLECFIQTGSVVLLAPLIPSLREGKGHKYYGMICNAFSSVTSSIAVDELISNISTSIDSNMQYVSIMVLASYTAKHILDPYQDQIVKHILFNHILIPTLLRCPSQALVHIYTTTSTTNNTSGIQFSFSDTSTECIVKQLTEIIVTDPFVLSQKSGTDAAAALLYVQSCAYRLLEVVYDRVPLNTIKTTITQSFAGPSASGKELTQHICRAAHKQLRAPKLAIYTNTTTTSTSTTNTADSLYATLHSNAYRCLAIVVAKTQTEEQFFDTFLFKEKPDETVWERVVGEHTLNENNTVVNNNVFSSVSGRFATVAIGTSTAEQSSVQYRNNRLRSVNASAVGGTNILSQYLKGSIVDSSSASQVYDGSVGTSNASSGRGTSHNSSGNSSSSSTLQQIDSILHKDEYTVSQYSYTKHPSTTYNPSYTIPTTGASHAVQGLDDHTIYLEMNHINAVPAMACMVRVITRMDVLFAHKWYTDPTTANNITTYSEASMPKWLVECRDKISSVGSIGQSGNVRLFVLRLFMNQPVASIISGYMEFILPGVLNCVLYDLCNIDPHTSQSVTTNTTTSNKTNSTPTKGSCYSYTLRDFVFTLTDTWRCKPTTYCTTQATLLLNYLLLHLYDSDPDILKENVLSVKSLLSLWLPYTTTNNTNTTSTTNTTNTTHPYTMHLVLTPLLTLLNSAHYGTGGAHASASSRGSDSVRRRLAGLEIVKHLLQCGYPLLETAYNTNTSSLSTSNTQMLTSILDCIKFPRKEVIQAACEVAGLLLQSIAHYTTTNTTYKLLSECTTFHTAVQATIDKKALEKGGSDIVATCMRYVSVYYTDFVTREMLMKTVYNVGRLSARSKYEYLDMLCVSTSTTTMSDVSIVNDILKPHLLSFLADLTTIVYGRGKYTLRLPMVCINTLVLLTKHIDTVSIDVIESVLGGSSTEGVMLCIGGSSVVQVRDAAYKMLLALWRTRLANGSSGDNSRLLTLRKRVLQLLLNGLRDKDTIGMNTSPSTSTATNTNTTTNTTASDTTLYHNPYHWSDDNTSRIGIRKQVFAFFQSTLAQQGYGLSTTITQRLHTLMGELYDPAQCSQWLQYSSFLILVLGSESASYNSALFKHSLADNSTYSAMTVNTALGNSNNVNSVTPLFSLERTSQVVSQYSQQSSAGSGASSSSINMNNFTASQNYLMSQSARGNNTDPYAQSVDGAGSGERRKGYVRGTQQFSWTQTQQYAATQSVGGDGSGIRANGGSGVGASRRSGAFVDMASTQYNAFSSMMNTQQLSNASTSTATTTSSNTSNTTNTSNTQLMPPPTTLPTRYITTQRVPIRFSHKHTSTTSTTSSTPASNTTNTSEGSMINRATKYASVAAMQASVKMAEHRKQTNKSKQRVVVYRKYRTGELPDINITLSDVLSPLQSLCLYDESCAGLVFGVLYDAQYKLHLHNSSGNSTSVANTTTSASTDVVHSMCADLHTMLQSARVTGATNTTLYATLLRRSAHKLTLCIDHALHTTPIPTPTATAGISRGRARPVPTTTITTTTPTIAPALLLPAELIAECALQSCNYHTGIQLLEQQLLLLDKASVQVVSCIVDSSVTIAGSSSGASGSGAISTTQLVTTNTSTAAGKKRNILTSQESDCESVISTATANNTTGKRTRKSKTDTTLPTTANTANNTSANTNMEVVAEDEATQQAEGLTADELLNNMSSANASAGSGGRRSYRNTTVAHTPSTTSTAANTHTTNSTTSGNTTLTALQQNTLSHTRKSIWFQLYRLYDSIGEKHILLGLTAKLGEHTISNTDTSTSNTTTTTTTNNTTSTTNTSNDSVCMDSIQRSVLTKRALDAELSGDYVEAVRIYALLNEQADTSGRSIVNANPTGSLGNSSIGNNDTAHTTTSSIVSDVTQNERDLWDERSLLCLKQLCDWQQLYDCVEKITRISTLHTTTREDNRPVWEILSTLNSANPAQNRLKERLLPHYLHSLLHLSSGGSIVNSNGDGNIDSITQIRNNFLERVLSYQPTHITNTTTSTNTSNLYELRQYVESHFPTELALYSASCGQYARSRVYSEQAMQRFVTQWRSMHPCATQARCQLLQQLQPILELRDAADYNTSIDLNTINSIIGGSISSGSGRGGSSNSVVHKLTHLLGKWSISSPSTSTDDVSHWADVNCVRATALYPTLQQYNNTTTTITGTSTSSPIDNPFLRAKLQLATLHVSTAAAAVQQGVLSAVKTQLECNNAIRRQVFGKKALLTMPEVQVVYHYNSRSIDRLSSGISSITSSGSGRGGTSTDTSAGASTNDAYAQIESMFTKTMSLLDKKAQLLRENRQSHSGGASGSYGSSGTSTAMDTLQLSLLRADWLVKWSNSMSTDSSTSGSSGSSPADRNSRVLDALTLYEQCISSADTILRTTNTTNTTITSNIGNIGERSRLNELQQHLCSSYTQHMDCLLQYFERSSQSGTLADAYVALTRATTTTTNTTNTTDPRILAAIQTVRCFVQGLKLGNSYCIQRVLRLVQIIGQYSTYTQDILQSQLHSIPAWVFLQYAAQLMGSLDRPEGAVISRILEYTATTYPNALYYPYRITSEFLGTNGRANSSRLTRLIDSPLQDSMIQALGGLTHPEHRLSDCWKEIDTVYRNNTSTGSKSRSSDVLDEMSKHKVQAVYNKIKTTILDSEWSSVGDKIGTYNKYFARAAKPIVEKICGSSGEKLYTGTVVQCKKVLEAVRDGISSSKLGNMQYTGGKVALSEFSQYLCDFDPLLCRIEVPGQYSKYNSSANSSTSGSNVCSIPNLSTHEYITSIDPTLLVMSSIRKPKRITLYGSSGGVYMFLVKGGEDLRNDERIQQLFMLMNSVVNSGSSGTGISGTGSSGGTSSANSSSIGDRLRARTYAVIPMTSQVGILEWVPNTTPLKDIISTEMGKDPLLLQLNPQALSDGEVDLMRLNAYEKRLLWVKSHNYADYHKMYQRANRAQAMDMYTHITSELSDDYIRRRFVNMAHTAEAYLTIRDQFAKSLAVSSLFGYILGIGDRHLENLLIDLTTGSVIQIDFGICFGMGSSVLQVPELLPFRLTPQLRGVLRPLDGVGLLRHYMVLCLQALRADAGSGGSGWSNSSAAGDSAGSTAATSSKSKAKTSTTSTTATTTELPASYSGIIPNALEVYLNDPVVDWLKGAANKSNKDSERAKTASGSSSSSGGTGTAKGKGGTHSAEELAEASAASAREEWTERRADLTWEPRRRVHAAVGKITGADPVSVLVRDLGVNPWVAREKSLAALTAIVSTSANAGLGSEGNSGSDSGSSGNSNSSGSEDTVLSVGQQVDKLINLATDGDVLVRQWGGLQTWL